MKYHNSREKKNPYIKNQIPRSNPPVPAITIPARSSGRKVSTQHLPEEQSRFERKAIHSLSHAESHVPTHEPRYSRRQCWSHYKPVGKAHHTPFRIIVIRKGPPCHFNPHIESPLASKIRLAACAPVIPLLFATPENARYARVTFP